MKVVDRGPMDVVILGGGPTGSTAALVLAAQGWRVGVLERARFPRFHVGESLLPYNTGLFEELGLTEVIEGCRFMPKRAAQFHSADSSIGARLEFAKGRFTEFKQAWQVERAIFDEKLLRTAEERGAQIREGTTYLEHEIKDGLAQVRYRDEGGKQGSVSARFVIDATGMAAVTARQSGLRRERRGHRRVALFGHFSGVEMPVGEERGDIVLVVRDRAWAWLIPLDDERTSVGLVMGREEFDNGRGNHEGLWERIVTEAPELRRRLSDARRIGGLHVVADYSFEVEKLVEPRLVRAGDAAGFLDPVFSSGVMLAMESGRDAARIVNEALTLDQAMTDGMRRYERKVRRHLAMFWEFVEAFYTRPFIELFFQPQSFLSVTSAVNAVLAGRTHLPWAVRWRLRLFFFLVRLQKHVPVVSRLVWTDGKGPRRIRRGSTGVALESAEVGLSAH